MIQCLTSRQLILLRRSKAGLRVWETGSGLRALLDELRDLVALGLLTHDETHGYQILAQGELCLRRFDIHDIQIGSVRKRAGIHLRG
jgi:hypothetical protein